MILVALTAACAALVVATFAWVIAWFLGDPVDTDDSLHALGRCVDRASDETSRGYRPRLAQPPASRRSDAAG